MQPSHLHGGGDTARCGSAPGYRSWRTPCWPCCPTTSSSSKDDVIIEPAAIVCDFSRVGAQSLVRAGTCVKQRARFGDRGVPDGFPAGQLGTLDAAAAVGPGSVTRPARTRDPVVSAREASRVFAAARHPSTFSALDEVDHAVSEPRRARHVGPDLLECQPMRGCSTTGHTIPS